MSDYNFKVKCIDVGINVGTYDCGGIYKVKNGALTTNVGGSFKGTNQKLGFRNIDELNDWSSSKFEEVFDEEIKEDKKVGKFKVGDVVEIIGNSDCHRFKIGDIVELYEDCGGNFKGRTSKNETCFNHIKHSDMKLIKDYKSTLKTFTITTSDTTTTLTDGTHTTSINRYYTDKHDDMIALEEVVKKYKSEMEEINKPTKGKDLIGVYIPKGTKFRIINVEPHRRDNYVFLDEYIGKVATFNSRGFTFNDNWFHCSGTFEEEYMRAIDKKNGGLCWRYDEVEILWED